MEVLSHGRIVKQEWGWSHGDADGCGNGNGDGDGDGWVMAAVMVIIGELDRDLDGEMDLVVLMEDAEQKVVVMVVEREMVKDKLYGN